MCWGVVGRLDVDNHNKRRFDDLLRNGELVVYVLVHGVYRKMSMMYL